MRKFQLIYADPPWKHRDAQNAGKRGAVHKYDVMSIEDIRALNVEAMAADNALLAMWWSAQMPAEALQLVEAWGFTFKTMTGLVWDKRTTAKNRPYFGAGSYTKQGPECCLFAVRNKGKARWKRQSASVRARFEAPWQGEHSVKPDLARQLLVELCGDVPRVELFAKRNVDGWDAWGNRCKNTVHLAERGQAERLEVCSICSKYTSEWVDPEWSHGRVCLACESGRAPDARG